VLLRCFSRAIRLRSLPGVRQLPERRHACRPTGAAGRGRPPGQGRKGTGSSVSGSPTTRLAAR
jgi:hypothetical protein